MVTTKSAPGPEVYVRVQQGPEFARLRHRFRVFVFPMTAAFLSWYLLYVLSSAWARDFMGQKLVGNINVAFVFGLLQFLTTFLIAIAYSRYADRKLDPESQRIRELVEREAGR